MQASAARVIPNAAKRSEESKMAPNKNRNQGVTRQNETTVSQVFRPLAPLGVTIERPLG